MHQAGVSSWSARVSEGTLLELPLFVRDVHGLVGGDVPPLLGTVRATAPAAGETRASTQWAVWWQRSLAAQFTQPPRDGTAHEGAQQQLATYTSVYDPPDFPSLADSIELQRLVLTSDPSFRRWDDRRVRPAVVPEWELMKRVAEDIAFDRQVDLGAVHANIVVLPVKGVWWQRVGPGQMLCSTTATAQPAAATSLLWEAFDSYVRSNRSP